MPPLKPERRVTLRDIARKLNVSHTTVSRALQDTPRFSKELRARVKQTAAAMGYRPDPMLSALQQYRRSQKILPVTAALAWINQWPNPKQLRAYQEFDLYWKGAAQEADRSGFRLEEFVINPTMPPARVEKILTTRNIRGILIPPHGGIPLTWDGLHWENFCVVRFGHSITFPRTHLVSSDQLTDGMIAVENIWKKGYRRIGLAISERAHTRFSAGYYFRQKEWSLEQQIPALKLPETGGGREVALLRTWLEQYRPDAILTDLSIMPAWLKQSGFQVPHDLGLAALSVLDSGIDAGIDQNSEEIGRAAVQLLISLINHNECGIPKICRELLVEGSWVDGKTLPHRQPRDSRITDTPARSNHRR
jgi:LacI family transcriptional regulator